MRIKVCSARRRADVNQTGEAIFSATLNGKFIER